MIRSIPRIYSLKMIMVPLNLKYIFDNWQYYKEKYKCRKNAISGQKDQEYLIQCITKHRGQIHPKNHDLRGGHQDYF